MNKDIVLKNFKALNVSDDYIIGARGYRILKYFFLTNKFEPLYNVIDKKNELLSQFKLTRRFFRAEITGLYHLKNKTDLVIAKKGIFRREVNSKIFTKCFSITRGSRPLNMCVTDDDVVYFGEYFSNASKEEVYIYKSKDYGKTWETVYKFNKGSINHIHGIFFDPFTHYIWVVTGDREEECIIGYTDDDFKSFKILFRGGQDVRTCNLLFYDNFIVYATDSQYIQNKIKIIDRNTLNISDLCTIHGSGIYSVQSGKLALLSSTIEPSSVNTDKYSRLYISSDGKVWNEVDKYKKDIWHKRYFQFGSIQFPSYDTKNLNKLVFSGRSLKGIDGNTVVKDFDYK